MDNLIIEKTQNTLDVNFNSETGICKLTGSSYPENSIIFFKPISDWMKQFNEQDKGGITLDLDVTYINTSSTKCILDIFEILEGFHKEKRNIKINWYYPRDEDDLRETGEELTEHLKLPVNFIAYKGQ
ncbi:MAG: DUF1987 domain-containing protein [Spirochaetes bacterium]|nr:DUF1987 domain-containing protein [Spirochaetota bacterium]